MDCRYNYNCKQTVILWRAMKSIKERLEEELQGLDYVKRCEAGLILTDEDIKTIFAIVKNSDQEVKPLLEIMEVLVENSSPSNYILIEKCLIQLLKYYNIIENNDLIKCRHKFFFTETKKLVKKPFYSPKVNEKIKDELAIHGIFKKIK
jgi:hypothetical protein